MNIIDIKDFDFNNGEGIRVSLWVSGCPHRCLGCHNPESWDKNSGVKFQEKHLDKIIKTLGDEIEKDFSVLGGEPLVEYNRNEVEYICKTLKETYPTTNIWVWTGYNFEDVKHFNIMKYIDVLIDGKFIEDEKDATLIWRPNKTQRIIDVQESLKQNKIIKYID